ncbi:HAD family hydrolase [Flexibacterium corallicola]|uniref:HAD family hydrolase n=1 Tax=Flexibacterium corallicola TaxID=3037259 RepID=UPI00286F0552|nr:HAD family hydrolase [Pseudovibrio sp. M1P-2-3]
MNYDLLIWDCDGCLIDSEYLACALEAELLTKAGYFISTNTYIERFMGVREADVFAQIEKETGRDFRYHGVFSNLTEQLEALFKNKLESVSGVYELFEIYRGEMCVASGSSLRRLEYTLKLTGLYPRLHGHIFSADQVELGKPAPDIFLYAADKMGVSPERCLVIEDSCHGVEGALKAGMTVLGFTGASHYTEGLRRQLERSSPHRIFSNMRELTRYLMSE